MSKDTFFDITHMLTGLVFIISGLWSKNWYYFGIGSIMVEQIYAKDKEK